MLKLKNNNDNRLATTNKRFGIKNEGYNIQKMLNKPHFFIKELIFLTS